MLFHSKALEVYTHTLQNLETIDIQKDLEVAPRAPSDFTMSYSVVNCVRPVENVLSAVRNFSDVEPQKTHVVTMSFPSSNILLPLTLTLALSCSTQGSGCLTRCPGLWTPCC